MMLTAAFALTLIVNVSASADVPASVVTDALAEANAVWLKGNVTFVWRRDLAMMNAPRVLIRRETIPQRDEGLLPLGWVIFDDDRTPKPEIHVSYENAVRLLEESRNARGQASAITPFERNRLVARAMGRALAHELGHYLLASKAHTATGLMRASRSAAEFFHPETRQFDISVAQRSEIAARLNRQSRVASR